MCTDSDFNRHCRVAILPGICLVPCKQSDIVNPES